MALTDKGGTNIMFLCNFIKHNRTSAAKYNLMKKTGATENQLQ